MLQPYYKILIADFGDCQDEKMDMPGVHLLGYISMWFFSAKDYVTWDKNLTKNHPKTSILI